MLGMLLFISFILHAISFYWIFRLKRRSPDNDEIESLLAMYTEGMKEENDKLVHRLQDINVGGVSKKTVDLTPVSNQENLEMTQTGECAITSEKSWETTVEPKQTAKFSEEAHGPPIEEVEDRLEQSLQAKALFLSKQGLDHTEIAKKLGCGKGEVELLLKFHR